MNSKSSMDISTLARVNISSQNNWDRTLYTKSPKKRKHEVNTYTLVIKTYEESHKYIYGKNKKLPECFKVHDKQPMKRENDKGL